MKQRRSKPKKTKDELFEEEPDYQAVHGQMSNYNFIMIAFLLGGGLMAFFWLFSSQGKLIYKEEIPIIELLKDSTGFKTKFWEMKSSDKVHQFEVKAFLPTSIINDLSVDVEIFDDDSVRVNQMNTDFYYEFGRDSDGPWTEKNERNSKYFTSNAGGKYYAVIFGDAAPFDVRNYYNSGNQFIFAVYQGSGIFAWRYGLASILLGSVGLVLLLKPWRWESS